MKHILFSLLIFAIATPAIAQTETNQAPTISNIRTESPLPGIVEITWETSFETSGCIKYGKATPNEERVCNQSNFTKEDHKITLENLDPGSTYRYQIVAVNSFSEEFQTLTLTFDVRGEEIAITTVDIIESIQRADITFVTDYPCTSRIEYREKNTLGFDTQEQLFDMDEHEFILLDLIQDTTYQYRIICEDENEIMGYFPGDPTMWNQFRTLSDPDFVPEPEEPKTEEEIAQEEEQERGQTVHDIRIETIKRERKNTLSPDPVFTQELSGRLLLQVEERGEAWYVSPRLQKRVYLADGNDAYQLLRDEGEGITNANLNKIPVDLSTHVVDIDTDGDGIADRLEEALGTNPFVPDSDGDGYNDRTEIEFGFNPLGPGRPAIDEAFAQSQAGKIFLQVQANGEAWYIDPFTAKRNYLGTAEDAYQVMRKLSLGISNTDIRKIDVLQ